MTTKQLVWLNVTFVLLNFLSILSNCFSCSKDQQF